MILAEKVAKVEFERIRKEKEDERKRLLELRAKKAQEAKNAKKAKDGKYQLDFVRCFWIGTVLSTISDTNKDKSVSILSSHCEGWQRRW